MIPTLLTLLNISPITTFNFMLITLCVFMGIICVVLILGLCKLSKYITTNTNDNLNLLRLFDPTFGKLTQTLEAVNESIKNTSIELQHVNTRLDTIEKKITV